MLKKMMELETIIGSTAVGLLAFVASWIAVAHFDWRYVEVFSGQPFDASQSIVAFTMLGSVIVIPLVVFVIQLKRHFQVESQ